MSAAAAAGAQSVLVPPEATRSEEIDDAPETAATIFGAVDLVVGGT